MVSNDVAMDSRIADRAGLTAQGTYALALLPIMVEKRVAGVVSLRALETGMFDEEELRLLLELVGNLSFALELMEKRQTIDYLAYYDVLLPRRTACFSSGWRSFANATRSGPKLAVSHRSGALQEHQRQPGPGGRRALLKQAAEWLTRDAVNASLVAHSARTFAVVLPGSEAGRQHALHQKIQHFRTPFRLNEAEFRIAVKVGVALFPGDGADAGTVLKNAETALKKAKARGERYVFYKQKMTDAVAGKLTLENQLRRALDNGEFVLHYQPKVSLASGALTSAEALIRWNDPETGLVPPGRFIPILEETGLIYEVGRWALRKAIEDYLRWLDAGLPAVRIAVNVSPLQLRNGGFIEEIRHAICTDSRAPAGLELRSPRA
jgi:predicted signal transduction protein with EAL and GGDEF domain